MNGDACPNVSIVYTCTTDVGFVIWTALPYFSQHIILNSSGVGQADNGSINISYAPSNPFTSTLTIVYSNSSYSTDVICSTGNNQMKETTYRMVIGKL